MNPVTLAPNNKESQSLARNCPCYGSRECTHKSRTLTDLAMSALPSEADIRASLRHDCFVPTTEVALIRSPRRYGSTWLRWSFGQPGLPQAFFVSREIVGPPRAQHGFEIGNTQHGVAAAEPWPSVLAPAVRPLHCSRRRHVIHVDSPDCPAVPLPPTTLLRHRGPGRNGNARSRPALLSPADPVGSGAWHARSARSPVPV